MSCLQNFRFLGIEIFYTKNVVFLSFLQENVYICSMKKIQKNTLFLVPVRVPERKFILDSMVASFRIEGISIPERRVQAIYARVNEKLKRPF